MTPLGAFPYGRLLQLYNTRQSDRKTNHRMQIPKPNETEGLGINWPSTTGDMDKLKALCEEIKSKM